MLLRSARFVVVIIVICISHTSCSKGGPSTDPPRIDTISSAIVYIGGDTLANGYDGSAVYWKNGSITKLPIGIISSVSSIYVDHNDIYTTVAGSTITDTITYWKNNEKIRLPDPLGFSQANYSITVSDGNIYVTGTTHEIPDLNYGAVYWKNSGNAVHLVPKEVTVHQSSGQAIAVSNGDIYIAGYLDYKAIYWKNGTPVALPVDTTFFYNFSTANSITINQGNVYVAGTVNLHPTFIPTNESIATYWKNNVPVRLTRGSVANAITVSGNDIYIAGGIYGADGLTRAAYWKNGTPVMLNPNYSIASAIAVNGTDVHIAGNIGEFNATYWKNGTAFPLGRGHARSIFLAH